MRFIIRDVISEEGIVGRLILEFGGITKKSAEGGVMMPDVTRQSVVFEPLTLEDLYREPRREERPGEVVGVCEEDLKKMLEK